MKANIKLNWYGGDKVQGYILQFLVTGKRYEYETFELSTFDKVIEYARYSPGKALGMAKKLCKLIK
jgi:hypothetical protein